MVFKTLPITVQTMILQHLDIESLTSVMALDKELSPFIREKIFEDLLHKGLQAIIVQDHPGKLENWKRMVYDTLPLGDTRRKVIVAALFYLLGKYPKPNIEEYTQVFSDVIDTEFMLYHCLGLSRQNAYTLSFRDCFRDNIYKESLENKLVQHPLFEEITGFKKRMVEMERQQLFR